MKNQKNWPPIKTGATVVTTEENPSVMGWTDEAKATRRWGVEGTVTGFHDSHGLSYEVTHAGDSTVGHYDPSEILETIPAT